MPFSPYWEELDNPFTQFMVHYVDGRGADAGLPGKIGLRPSELAKLSGQ